MRTIYVNSGSIDNIQIRDTAFPLIELNASEAIVDASELLGKIYKRAHVSLRSYRVLES